MERPDIEFTNSGGFFVIGGVTPRGLQWVNDNVDGAADGVAYCDDRRMALDIYNGAAEEGLGVFAVRA